MNNIIYLHVSFIYFLLHLHFMRWSQHYLYSGIGERISHPIIFDYLARCAVYKKRTRPPSTMKYISNLKKKYKRAGLWQSGIRGYIKLPQQSNSYMAISTSTSPHLLVTTVVFHAEYCWSVLSHHSNSAGTYCHAQTQEKMKVNKPVAEKDNNLSLVSSLALLGKKQKSYH